MISAKSMRILTLILSDAALPSGRKRPWLSVRLAFEPIEFREKGNFTIYWS